MVILTPFFLSQLRVQTDADSLDNISLIFFLLWKMETTNSGELGLSLAAADLRVYFSA